MTKHLILMRHAKSAWDHPEMDDHDRPLNARGRAGATKMGEWLKALNVVPDHVILSDSARTTETWSLVRAALGSTVGATPSRSLYLAPDTTMFKAIQDLPETAEVVLMIGHQPGMSALLERLADGSEPASRSRAYQNFSTGATALVDLPVASWADVGWGSGVFSRFATPKELVNA